MLVELHERGHAFAIRAEDVCEVQTLNDGRCQITLDWSDPPTRYIVDEAYDDVKSAILSAIYEYEVG